MTSQKLDLFKVLSSEAEHYRTLDQIESLSDASADLAPLPVQPLYLALKSLSAGEVSEFLPRLSREQRTAFLDIDLWKRDDLDVDQFPYWLMAYHQTESDDLKFEFAKSDQFSLFLKGKFNIWTFDVEDPEYPDHDNYFLTEDNQLLFEFEEDYPFLSEVKDFVKILYSEMGVENAYAFLFKLVSDGFMSLQEDEYRLKKERMREFGFVDYYDALEFENPFVHFEQMNGFIFRKSKEKYVVPTINDHAKNQTLHLSSLIPFKDHFNSVVEELNKIDDQKRLDFLQFNFIRLLNGEIELNSALKKGSMAMNRTGASVKNVLTLAVSYLNSSVVREKFFPITVEESIFQRFDFIEIYRIGISLLKIPKKDVKKLLTKYGFENEVESFLGKYWEEFLDLSFEEEVKFISANSKSKKAQALLYFEEYEEWRFKMKTLETMLPFIHKFYEAFTKLKNEGQIADHYYLNYTVDTIDYEALLLSSFANHFLGTYNEINSSKVGLTIDEFKSFSSKVITSEGEFVLTPEIYQKINLFAKTFGLDQVVGFNNYLQKLIEDQLVGYDYESLEFEEFKHVGGPILLNRHKH